MQIYTTIYIKHCKILAIDLHCLQLTCYFYSTSLAFLYVWFQSKLDKSLIALQNDENWTAFWHMQVYLYISSWLLSDQFLCSLQTRTCFSDGYFFWHRWLQLNSIWYFSYLCFPSSLHAPGYKHWKRTFSVISILYYYWRVISKIDRYIMYCMIHV